jgi:hypothetical protein
MTSPIALPDWLPWWVPILVLVPLGLYLLAFLIMPFSVLGVKARLESIDARLDEIQGEIRMLSLRLPEPGARAEDGFAPPSPNRPVRPPIPPAAPARSFKEEEARRFERPARPRREEPRLDWP